LQQRGAICRPQIPETFGYGCGGPMSKQAIKFFLLALVSAAGAACISDDTAAGEISISPSRLNLAAGSGPVVFTATVGPNAGRITWSLDGPGELAARGDSEVAYTPPATVNVSTAAVVAATLVFSGRKASASIQIDPADAGTAAGEDALRIVPASSAVYAGSPALQFSAVLVGSAGGVAWSLVGPGNLSFPAPLIARYAPPASVDVDTNAILRAYLSGSAATATANILVRRAVGNLAVNVSIPPGSGLRPNIMVTGPSGFARAITGSETLSGLLAGSYGALANPEVVAGSIVTTVYLPRVSGSPALVTGGGTATIEVAYSARPGSGHGWVADSGARRLRGYGGGQLTSSGRVSAEMEIDTGEGSFPISAALGSNGDLWLLVDPFTLGRYTSARQLSGAPPDVTLGMGARGGCLDYASGLAFDRWGNLWLASNAPPGPDGNRRILKFAASRLLVSDSNPLPDVTIRSSSRWYPIALAFDRVGNLWVADFSNDRLVKFSPGQLLADGAPTPATILSNVGPGNPLSLPVDTAIDADGNLWVSNLADEHPGDLVMYSATQAAAGGSPNPAIRILRPTLRFARGLAFDASGGLWMSIPGALARFSRSQLSSGGSPTPLLVQDTALVFPRGPVFSSPPESIPLYR
jgi:hypothetical protein